MLITYELTRKDILAGVISNHQRSIILWLLARVAFTFGIIGAFVGILCRNVPAVVNVFPLCVLLLLYAGLYIWVLPWWASRLLYSKNPSMQGSRSLRMDDSGVHFQWDGGSSDLEWKTFIRWFEGKNHFLLYTSRAHFHVVPKRALAEQQLPELRALLSQRVHSNS